jgi:hypothetical protein
MLLLKRVPALLAQSWTQKLRKHQRNTAHIDTKPSVITSQPLARFQIQFIKVASVASFSFIFIHVHSLSTQSHVAFWSLAQRHGMPGMIWNLTDVRL